MASRAPDPEATAAWLARDAVDVLPRGELARQLGQERPLRIKLGIDPTAPDIHLGHTVVLRKLREFQDLGHLVVLIIGDYTARVGDPSGRSSTRPVLDAAQIDANAQTFQKQAFSVLRSDQVEVRRNGEWLDMAMNDLFALTRTTTVAQLLERDDFAKRFSAHSPISVLELLYPLLQGYDSVAVRADVELGGTDQKFNLLLARDIQRQYGVPEQSVLTMPILPGTDGERRMSKSLGNYVGVPNRPPRSTARRFSLPDAAMPVWYALLLGQAVPEAPGPRDAKRAFGPGARHPVSRAGRSGPRRAGIRPRPHCALGSSGGARPCPWQARRAQCTCPPCSARRLECPRRRPAGSCSRAASGSTGGRWAPSSSS